MQVDSLGRSVKVVDSQGRATQELALFFESVSSLPIIIGTGDPEGAVAAAQSRLYMDSSGTTGSILYIKKYSDITGDKTQGWIPV